MKRLKPLEEFATLPNEFKELSYALTCNSVQEISLFKDWGKKIQNKFLIQSKSNKNIK